MGELLIDLISTEFAESLDVISNFKRLPGGSPANLCMNMARLGNNTKLVATVGNDNLGQYLKSFVQSLPIDCKDLMQCDLPTTLILVTRSKSTANFEAYRSADCQILPSQLSDTVLKNTSIFHTTCLHSVNHLLKILF